LMRGGRGSMRGMRGPAIASKMSRATQVPR
jgi:hypothetical protein